MKKIITLAVATFILAACADTRNHVNKDATSWNKVQYQSQEHTTEAK
ncbi:membrane lipoprotein lipid attachment site-containing protein [Neisseriaceae bacterium B1]